MALLFLPISKIPLNGEATIRVNKVSVEPTNTDAKKVITQYLLIINIPSIGILAGSDKKVCQKAGLSRCVIKIIFIILPN